LEEVSRVSTIFAIYRIKRKTIAKKSGDTILIGRKPVKDALTSGQQLEKVWIDSRLKGDYEKEIRTLTRERNIPLQYLPKEKLHSISGHANHQGVAAQLAIVTYHKVEDVLPLLYEQGKTPAILVLDGIEDVRNIGALARSAVWFGMDAIVIPSKKSARINSFAHKASAGAIKDIPICREQSMTKTLDFLKASGLTIILADSGTNNDDSTPDFNEPIALILGSEGKGVSKEIRQRSDLVMTIPGTGNVESLNVSVAGAILMSQIFNARQHK